MDDAVYERFDTSEGFQAAVDRLLERRHFRELRKQMLSGGDPEARREGMAWLYDGP